MTGLCWSRAGNLSSMMQSSNGLDQMRALGSISSGGGNSSGGMVPAAMQLAQRGALGGAYPAMLQQQYLQQTLPWLLRVQVRGEGAPDSHCFRAAVHCSNWALPRACSCGSGALFHTMYFCLPCRHSLTEQCARTPADSLRSGLHLMQPHA